MKKSTLKIMSLLLTTAIASAIASFSVGAETIQYNVSATETTRIEGEAASEISGGGGARSMLTDGSRKALSYASVQKADGVEYYAKYVVNTEFAGSYSINAVASVRSETYTTDWTIYANTTDNAATGYVKGADVTTNWFSGVFKEYKCGTIYLNKGINEIYWKLGSDSIDGKFQAALDYIELTPPATFKVASSGTTRIEGEAATEISGGGGARSMLTDGSRKALSYASVQKADGVEYYAKYVVNTEFPGSYSINAVASIRSQTYTTDWTIYANTTDNAATAYTQGADVTTNWFSGVFKEYNCGTIYLNKGINEIYWKIGSDSIDGKFQAALDYIELTAPETTSVSATAVTRIEGEDATGKTGGAYKRKMLNDGSRYALTYSPNAPVAGIEHYAEYLVNVELEGYYSLNTVASVRSETYTTDWTIYANTTDNAATSYVKRADVTTDWFGGVFKEYNCGTIYLNKGINTIYWKVNVADAANNQLQAAIDYIELTPPESTAVSATGVTRIEGEDATGKTGGAYERKMLNDGSKKSLTYSPVEAVAGEEYYSEYLVNAEKAGYYSLSAVASIRSMPYTTDWDIYANEPENKATYYTVKADVATDWYSDNFKEYDCGTIYLNEGINRIYWKLNAADAPDGKLQAALDYIELDYSLLTVLDAKITDGTFTAKLIKGEQLSRAAKAYLVVFENNSSNKIASIKDIDVDTAEGEKNISEPLTLSEGNSVNIFVWYGDNNEPLCNKVTLNY